MAQAVTITAYKTFDGKLFLHKNMAEKHEEEISKILEFLGVLEVPNESGGLYPTM